MNSKPASASLKDPRDKSQYKPLLSDIDVLRWHQNVKRGSEITADVYLRRLGGFCKENNLEPGQLLRMKQKALSDLLLDNVTRLESDHYAGSYIKSIMKAVTSWLKHNRIVLTSSIKIIGQNATPALQGERVPTPDELGNILRSASPEQRVADSFMAFSGLRPGVEGNYKGTDGLRIGDFPELTVDNSAGTITFTSIPTVVTVRAVLSKAGHQYLTFLCDEGCLYLKEYLEARMREGEKLAASSPIVRPRYANKEFIRTSNVGDKIRNSIRAAGHSWRPYVLRCYFDTRMLLAESNRLIIRDYRVFWMGHKGDIEQLYTLNKQVLPQDVLEDMRESYRKSQHLLTTIDVSGRREEDAKITLKKQLLLVAGYKKDELESLDIDDMDDEVIYAKCRERLLGILVNNGSKQRVIHLNQVEKYLTEGWEYVDRLPANKAIVRLPAA